MKQLLQQVIDLITLKALKGGRSQLTALLTLAINAANSAGYLHLAPDQIETVNKFAAILFAYFFSDKGQK